MRRPVLHVVPGFGTDGTLRGMERVAATLVKGLEDSPDYEPRLCVFRDRDPVDERHGLSAPISFLGYQGFDQDWQMAMACARRLRQLVKDMKPEIVHSHLWPAAFTCGVAVAGLGIRHVIHIHDQRAWLASTQIRHRIRRLSQRAVMRITSPWFIACSGATADYSVRHLACDAGRMTVIRSGIDTRAFSAIPPADRNSFVLGMAGTLAREKGIGETIKAVAALKQSGIPCRLKIAGEGTARKDFERGAAELGVQDQVEFLGAVSDMAAFYAGIDVFVLPSFGEGLPLSVLEAMAAARPVVASALSGIPEAVSDGTEGLLVPAGNTDALVAALARLAGDRALRCDMGGRARDRALREFSADRMVAECARVYEGFPAE